MSNTLSTNQALGLRRALNLPEWQDHGVNFEEPTTTADGVLIAGPEAAIWFTRFENGTFDAYIFGDVSDEGGLSGSNLTININGTGASGGSPAFDDSDEYFDALKALWDAARVPGDFATSPLSVIPTPAFIQAFAAGTFGGATNFCLKVSGMTTASTIVLGGTNAAANDVYLPAAPTSGTHDVGIWALARNGNGTAPDSWCYLGAETVDYRGERLSLAGFEGGDIGDIMRICAVLPDETLFNVHVAHGAL